MILRFTSSAIGAVLLTSIATAQRQMPVSPITSPVKDAGTYHLATGTWSRGVNQVALAGPEVLYDNTCTAGYFLALGDGDILLDSGRIPSTSSPSGPVSLVGLYDNYIVNGFEIGYCSFEPLTTNLDISFVDMYSECLNAGALPTPLVTFNLLNFPAGGATGTLGCWVVALDLSNSTGMFLLGGDADDFYDNVPSLDSFGWTWTQTIPTTGSDSGPMLGGDPSGIFNGSCGGVGGGTTFVGAASGPGTGIGNSDIFELGGSPLYSGCHWLGGYNPNPFAGFYMQVKGGMGFGPPQGVPYCFGDGTGASCPCSAFGAQGEGCLNTSGVGATLTGSGSSYVSNDTYTFYVAGVPGAKPGLLLRGSNQVAFPAGDGILCTAGQSQRSQVQFTSVGGTTFTDFNGSGFGTVSTIGAVTNFQFWYRDTSNTCSGAGFNFSNGWGVIYLP